MEHNSSIYREYLRILEQELVPAFGCTEPIAIAYAAALAAQTLGERPDRLLVEASGNIIKNVKSVIVPNTGGMKGIQAAAAAGVVSGRPEDKLELPCHPDGLHRGPDGGAARRNQGLSADSGYPDSEGGRLPYL